MARKATGQVIERKRKRGLSEVKRQTLEEDDLGDDETGPEQQCVGGHPARESSVAARHAAAQRQEDQGE